MSMLEKMARRLALDALERVKPGTYTSVVDGVGLYQMLDGNYQVGERLGAGDDDAPGIDYDTARETMVAMMAGQAGALVVVLEDAPMDSHLVQIAQLLVDSADVDTEAQDVADGAAIAETVKRALDYLDAARDDNRIKREKIAKLELLLEESRKLNATGQVEIERMNSQIQRWNIGANELQDKLNAANNKLELTSMQLMTAKHNAESLEAEVAGWREYSNGLKAALDMAMDKLAGVGK